jgi:hypothetical protein
MAALSGKESFGAPASALEEPAAQHVLRFEQQLQVPATGSAQYYEAPDVETAGAGSDWHVVIRDVGDLAQKYRVESSALDDSLSDSSRTASVEAGSEPSPAHVAEMFSAQMSEHMSQLVRVSYTTMNISFVTTAERLAGENVRSLFQLS